MGELWNSIAGSFKDIAAFLKAYDMAALAEVLRRFDWKAAYSNPITWLIGAPLLGLLVFRKMYRTIIFLTTVVAFMLLAQKTLTPPGEAMPLEDLLLFVGGSAGLLGVIIYFLFIRGD